MTNVIVAGHGGFGTAIQKNLGMLLGDTPGMLYVDFNPDDNLDSLNEKLNAAIAQCEDHDILFACDLSGGSPFRQAAMLCIDHPKYRAVAGLNVAGYAEMVYNLELPLDELCDLAMQTTHATVQAFPERPPEAKKE